MLLINNLKLSLDADFSNLKPIVAKNLRIRETDILKAVLYRKSVDARRKNDVHFCCSVLAEIKCDQNRILKQCKNAVIYSEKEYEWLKCSKTPENRPIVAGFGPAGMFCALTLQKQDLSLLS